MDRGSMIKSITKKDDYSPGSCDCCRYCKIQHVKRDMDTYWKCKIMKYKECYDASFENFSVFDHIPTWCPLKFNKEITKMNAKDSV